MKLTFKDICLFIYFNMNVVKLKVWSSNTYTAAGAGEMSQPICVCVYTNGVECGLQSSITALLFIFTFCRLSLFFPRAEWERAGTKLTAVCAPVWNWRARRCWGNRKSDIVSGRNSNWRPTGSLSNWFPLRVGDSIWTPVFLVKLDLEWRFALSPLPSAPPHCSAPIFCFFITSSV